jgi:hypothetical protein
MKQLVKLAVKTGDKNNFIIACRMADLLIEKISPPLSEDMSKHYLSYRKRPEYKSNLEEINKL